MTSLTLVLLSFASARSLKISFELELGPALVYFYPKFTPFPAAFFKKGFTAGGLVVFSAAVLSRGLAYCALALNPLFLKLMLRLAELESPV